MKRLWIVLGSLASLTSAGCYIDDPLPPVERPVVVEGDLAVDIRSSAHVTLSLTGDELGATIAMDKGFGVAPAGLEGKGTVERFPEARTVLYAARFDAPADLEGPCGAEPVSLALALHRRGDNTRVGGSLTAYCGAATWYGVPAKVLRLSGDLPVP